jgi:hypothetical protein
MMNFPSLEWMKALQKRCNRNAAFNMASLWSDVKMVFDFGGNRYWLKLYKGKIIDLMEYLPMTNALGYDILVSGTTEAWKKLIERKELLGWLLHVGQLAIDGNMLECNRMYEAICVMADIMPDIGSKA